MTKLNRSIERGLAVLEVVHASGALSLAMLAERTDLPKPTLLRICATLESRRWLIRRNSDGYYRLGSAFPRADGRPKLVDRLVAVSKKEILQLSEKTGLAVDLAASIGGGRVEIVDTTRSFRKHGIYPETIGFRPSPVHSALGLAYLHAIPNDSRLQAVKDLAERLPRQDALVSAQLPKMMKAISAQGFAVRTAGHWGRAVDYGALPHAIAVPIVAGTEPLGAINLVWNASDYSVDTVVRCHLTRLCEYAKTIGAAYQASV